jgi:hypothetical protein
MMPYSVVLILMALSVAPKAMALDACFSQSTGSWRGPVWNRVGLQIMETEFQAGPDGTLSGQYRIHDAVPFDGTLSEFHQTGPCQAEFTWHDRDGSGTVRIIFEPERGRFIGRWGAPDPAPALIFDGYRTRPNVVS